MRALATILAAGLAASPAVAQEPDWSRARPVEIRLSSFAFAPAEIRLRAGEPVVLHLVNAAGVSHNFTAPGFFAAAAIPAQDKGLIYKGGIELAGHQTKDVTLIPRRGVYKLRCTHMMHTMLGMSGWIAVD